MDRGEIQKVVEQSSSRLFQVASPPVRYWLMTQVMGKEKGDAVLDEILKDCAKYPPKMNLLGKLRQDGTWPIPYHKKLVEDAGPGPPIGWTYRSILWNLFTLAEYVTGKEEGYVKKALMNILKWQAEEGYIPGPWTDVLPLPYFNAYALHDLLRFDMEEHSGTKKLMKWLESEQRQDGGWNIPYMMDVHNLPAYKWMKMWDFLEFLKSTDRSKLDRKSLEYMPSCQWSTMIVIWGMAESPRLIGSKKVTRAADFVLDRFFKPNPHPSYYRSADHWTKLTYPTRFGSGLLGVDVLTKLGYGRGDQRMEKPIRWLMEARSHDGLWYQSQRPHPAVDQWITLIAIRSLSRYANSR